MRVPVAFVLGGVASYTYTGVGLSSVARSGKKGNAKAYQSWNGWQAGSALFLFCITPCSFILLWQPGGPLKRNKMRAFSCSCHVVFHHLFDGMKACASLSGLSLLLTLMFLSYGSCVYAQKKKNSRAFTTERVEQLVDKYLADRAEVGERTTTLTNLAMYYGGLTQSQKTLVRKFLVSKIDALYSDEAIAEALDLADVYETLAKDAKDEALVKIYYYRGEDAAMSRGDTVMLKQQIHNIEVFPTQSTDLKSQCLVELYRQLEQIRNYVPVDQTVGGMWMSGTQTLKRSIPYFFLDVSEGADGKPKFTLNEKSAFLTYEFKSMDAQEEYLTTSDTIYVSFSNEDLFKPSAELNELFRYTGNTWASVQTMKAASSGGDLWSDVKGKATSVAVNALADAIFTPRKRTYILRMKLVKVNDWQMEAVIDYDEIRVKGDGDKKFTQERWYTVFTKMNKEDGWFWYDSDYDAFSPFVLDKKEAKAFRKSHRFPTRWGYNLSLAPIFGKFNSLQSAKLQYLTEERLLADGMAPSDSANWHKHNPVSVVGLDLSAEGKSLVVTKVLYAYPADMAGVKKGDVVTHVDGIPVETIERFTNIVRQKRPYEKVTLTILRKGKSQDITMETCVYLG